MRRITELAAWKALAKHHAEIRNVHLRELFAADDSAPPTRFEQFSCRESDIVLDYSKNRVARVTMDLLVDLAEEAGVFAHRDRMFAGERINSTEGRSVLHVALRAPRETSIVIDDPDEGRIDVVPRVHAVLDRMREYAGAVRSGERRGIDGDAFTDVVNIGIGGSDLGPVMATQALARFAREGPRVHFVSNVDATHLAETLRELHPETTLFIVASKTFTTQETMTNAVSARQWLLRYAGADAAKAKEAVRRHFVALSTAAKEVAAFGIASDRTFGFWDWVGGRYSMWGAIGLPVALAIGAEGFADMLAGARRMDEHFRTAPPLENLPLVLGLLGVWYGGFFRTQTHAVIPYDQYLHRLPAYLQQLDMESNGKRVTCGGEPVDDFESGHGYETGPVIFGEPGTNGQHSFFQLLHQGTKLVPADFLAALVPAHDVGDHHRKLLANFFAQTEALMRGRTEAEARADLEAEVARGKLPAARVAELLPHKVFPGNRPTNSIVFRALDPRTLGALVAMYEHKVFVQGVIWGVNSFDQYGVELGKQLAGVILDELTDDRAVTAHDSSTNGLIARYKAVRREA